MVKTPPRNLAIEYRHRFPVTKPGVCCYPNDMDESDDRSRQPAFDEGGRQMQEFVRELTVSQGRIRAFIVSLMPGSPDVGDVLQETNLSLWKSRERFQPNTNFIAWAFTIARLEVLHQREIIEARYQPGHSLEVHAQITGRKSGALRIALLRIRSELRECVTRTMEGSTA
jgi:DNA-directed RNA polymerase specialized sigma24 family protein